METRKQSAKLLVITACSYHMIRGFRTDSHQRVISEKVRDRHIEILMRCAN